MTYLTQKEIGELRDKAGAAGLKVLPQLQEIQRLLEQANAVFQALNPEAQNNLTAFHNEDSSLAYCLRWGSQAAYELVTVAEDQPTVADEPQDICGM